MEGGGEGRAAGVGWGVWGVGVSGRQVGGGGSEGLITAEEGEEVWARF